VPYDEESRGQLDRPFISYDTRTSTGHSLRHAVLTVIRQLADTRAAVTDQHQPESIPQCAPLDARTPELATLDQPKVAASASEASAQLKDKTVKGFHKVNATVDNSALNGSNYLLTSLTLFVTHEPCIMCSMALLHSRVKEVIYLSPMPATGGCGGAACLPRLDNVNHRFGITRWKMENAWREWWDEQGVEVDASLDA
jgi:tRNA-specific adenosine deaminase 3